MNRHEQLDLIPRERAAEALARHAEALHPDVAQRLVDMMAEAVRDEPAPKIDQRIANARRAHTEPSCEERADRIWGKPLDPTFDVMAMGLPMEGPTDEKARAKLARQRTEQRLADLEAQVEELRQWRVAHERVCGHGAAREE